MSFNWIASLLNLSATRFLSLWVTNFFDDYSQLEVDGLQELSRQMFERFTQELGWEVAMADKKRKPFASIFPTLGMEVSLARSLERVVIISNTESRKTALSAAIIHILKCKVLSAKQASALRGRFGFAHSALVGNRDLLL